MERNDTSLLRVLSLLACVLALLPAPARAAHATSGSSLDSVVYQATCPSPRPPVKVETQALGDGRIQAKVTAGFGPLTLIRFGAMQNAHVEVQGSSQHYGPNSEIKPPDGATSMTFFLVGNPAAQAGQAPPATTVPITVFDGCGPGHPWSSFFGGGAQALQSTASVEDTEVREGNAGNTVLTFTIKLSVRSSQPVTINYATADGTAKAGTDYVSANGTVTFSPGETSKTVTVQVRGNFATEPDKTFTITLSNPSNALIGRGTATARILNDDSGAGASGDSYTATVGQPLNVGAGSGPPPGLLANDQSPSNDAQVTSFGGLSAGGDVASNAAGSTRDLGNGGSLRVNADGSFTFTAPSTFTGAFSFRYRTNSSAGTAEATVTIDVRRLPIAADDTGYTVIGSTVLNVNAATGLLDNDDLGAPPSVVASFGGNDAGGSVTGTNAGQSKDLGNGGSLRVNPDGSFTFTAPSTVTGPFRFQYRLQNAAGTDDASVTIDVRRGPTITTTNGSTPFFEGGGAVTVDAGATIDSPGDANLTQLTATIQGIANSGQETLAATTAGTAITASYVAPTLTLSGNDTEARYQQVLQSITYQNTAPAVTSGARTIQFAGNANGQAGNTATKTVNVGGVNNPPVGQNNTVSTNEDTDYTFTAADFGFSDPGDAPPNTFLAVRIDTLPGVGTLANNGTPVAANGFVTKADIDAVRLKFSPAAGASGAPYATFQFRVQDNGGTANGGQDLDQTARTMTINVGAINDSPVVTASAGVTGFTENGAAVVIDGGLTVTDADDTSLESGSVVITIGCAAGDLLLFTDQNGITGVYTPATCTLALTGTSLVGNYQTALRSVQFTNGSDNPSPLQRTVTFQANDGDTNSSTTNATKAVSVSAINDAPVVTTTVAALSYTENDAPTPIDPGLGITDVDSPNLTGATVQITGNFQAGQDVLGFTNTATITGNLVGDTLTLSGSDTVDNYQAALRAVTYFNSSDNPNAGARTVTFAVNDGALASTPKTRNIDITAVNDAPVMTAGGTLNYAEGGAAAAIDTTLTITDPDSTSFSGATVSITAGFQNGADVLALPAPIGAITGSYNAGSGVLTLSGAGDATQYLTALESVTYNNTSDNPGTARTITWVITDSAAAPSTGVTSSIAITATNDAPALANLATAPPDPLTYNVGATAMQLTSSVTVTDVDNTDLTGATVKITAGYESGDILTFTAGAVTGSQVNETLTLNGPATLAQFETALRSVRFANNTTTTSASRTIEFQVNDGATLSNAPTRTVQVVANTPPVVTTTVADLTYTENDPATPIDAGITVTDDGTTLAFATITLTTFLAEDVLSFTAVPATMGDVVQQSNVGGVLTLTSAGAANLTQWQTALRAVSYANTSNTPNTTDRTVSFQVDDGQPANHASNVATRKILVVAVNDPPTPANVTVNALASVPVTYPAGTLSGTDLEPGTTVTIDTVAGPSSLTNLISVSLNADGGFTITPTAGVTGAGAASFQYKVRDDGQPGAGVSSTGFGTVTVNLGGTGTFYVKQSAVGAGNCTLGAECTLATAVDGSHIGTNTDKRIFISDANIQGTTAVTLNGNGWLVGQGVGGADFPTVMGYNAAVSALPAGATHPAFPAINQTRPTVGGTVTVHNNSNVLGLNVDVDAGATNGLVGSGKSGVVVDRVNVTSGAGNAVDLTSTSIQFTGGNLAVTSGAGIGFRASGSSTVSVAGPGNTISSTAGKAIDLSGLTANMSWTSVTSTNSGTEGIKLAGLAAASNVAISTTTVTNSTGIGIDAGTSVIGSAVNFGNAAVTLTGSTGVSLSSNAGSTTFADLDISPDSNQKGLVASGNTATITTSTGTITAPGNSAIEIDGPAGRTPLAMTLTTVNSDGGTGAGIILKDTSGSFTIQGTGTAGSGGTIANKTGANITANAGNTDYNGGTTGAGVILENANDVELNRMSFTQFSNYGIYGSSVNGFVLANSTVTATAGQFNGDDPAADEGTVRFANLTGTATITNSTFSRAREANFAVTNTSGNLTFTASGSTFSNTHTTDGLQGLLLRAGLNPGQNPDIVANITTGTFTGNRARGIQAITNGAGTMEVNIGATAAGSGGTFDQTVQDGVAIDLAHNSTGHMFFNVKNATITNNIPLGIGGGLMLNVFHGTGASAGSDLMGRIIGNTLTGNGHNSFDGMQVAGGGQADVTVQISNNSITNVGLTGIYVQGAQDSATSNVNATIQSNTVTMAAGAAFGIEVAASNSSADETTTKRMNATIGGAGALQNNVNSPDVADYRVTAFKNSQFTLPGYAGGPQEVAAIRSFVASQNGEGDPTTEVSVGLGIVDQGDFVNGAATTLPTNSNP